MVWGHDLQSHRQPRRVEARRHIDRWTAGHRHGDHDFHPAVVGIHFPAGDFRWPVGFCVEWEDLCRRQDEVIIFLEEAAHGLIPGAAEGGGGDDVGGAEF